MGYSLKSIASKVLNKIETVLLLKEEQPFPHLFSPFGIPGNQFTATNYKLKIIIDPSPKYFNWQMKSDLKKYDKTLLIHGCEPIEINNIKNELITHGSKFTKVYSFDKDVLKNVTNSELFCFGSCWVVEKRSNYTQNFNADKKFKLSFIRSLKKDLPGHKLRHDIVELFQKKYDFDLFFPKERIESKTPLFVDSMFHVTIENSQNENYFTEKLIDCFMSYTIPIYWGCTTISEFFDTNGIIQFNTKEELATILNNLTPEDYYSRLESVKKNYAIAKNEYAFFFERINELILKL
jgi:hypothetical protein